MTNSGAISEASLLRAIIDPMQDLIAAEDTEFRYLYFNEAYRREFRKLWGTDLEVGMSMVELMAPWPEEQQKAKSIWQRALDGETYNIQMEFGPSPLETNHYDLRFIPIRDASGKVTGAAHVLRDVTAQVRAENHRELLIRELNHRVKNTLAVVQAIARQSFRNSNIDRTARATFEGRLANLGSAHDLLSNTHWEYTTLEQVVGTTLASMGLDMSSVSAGGAQVILTSEQAVSLSMALYELATNAIKHGALSLDEGRVDISWNLEGSATPHFTLVWKESGGPSVSQRTETGFGMILIETALERDLRGSVEVSFDPAGLLCTITAPVETGTAP